MSSGPFLIVLFAKPPTAGTVKTRLAPLVGEEGAAELAGAFLVDTLAVVSSLDWARVVIASPGAFPAPWGREIEGYPLWDQGPGDLGARMERVLARGLAEGAAAAAILGTDCPGLTAEHLEAARRAFRDREALLSPSVDGGFYLIGLRRCPKGILTGLPWSTQETFCRTQERLRSLGLSLGLGPSFADVDEPEDLLRLEAALGAGELYAPATAATLRRLRSHRG